MAGETLRVIAGNAAGSMIELQQELVVGRATPGPGGLAGDSEISRVHARVYHDPSGQLVIEDLRSTNGTYVNGARIASPTALRAGDQVRFGQTTVTVEGGAADAGATAVGAVMPPAGVAPPPVPVTPPMQPLPPPPLGPQYAAPPPQQQPAARQAGGSKAPWIALAAAVVIALIVAGLATGGVFSGGSKKHNASTAIAPVNIPTTPAPTTAMPVPATPSTPSTVDYPPGFIDKLVRNCQARGRFTPGQCRCVYQTLQKKLTFVQFIAALQKTKGGHAPPVIISALRSCGAI